MSSLFPPTKIVRPAPRRATAVLLIDDWMAELERDIVLDPAQAAPLCHVHGALLDLLGAVGPAVAHG